jgi:hypothetical protein
MNYWLAQLILAARNSDDRDIGWMQILVFVILAVFYAVGSIVKAKANKTAPEGGKQIPRKPARKSPESTIDLQLLKQLWRPARPTPSSQPRPQVQPKLEELPEFTAETVKKLEGKRVAMPAEIPQAKYLSEILSDYDDPERLRKAILHYEILGKPLSLRDPSEHLIGF